jgi:D-inositol-3-phosphate glycosyltransferase
VSRGGWQSTARSTLANWLPRRASPTRPRLAPGSNIRSRLKVRSNFRGNLDKPLPGSTVPRGRITLQGWCVWGDRPAVSVEAHVNGLLVGQTATGTDDRVDVGRNLGDPKLARAGWCLTADLSWLEDQDEVDVVVTVWADPAVPPIRLGTLTLVLSDTDGPASRPRPKDEFVGSLDLPAAGDPIGPDFVKVAGWLVHPTAPTASVDILVNGQDAGRARVGLERPDAHGLHPVPHAAISGFEHLVDLSLLPDGTSRATIQVVARTIGGTDQAVLERSARLAPGREPQPLIRPDDSFHDRISAMLAAVNRQQPATLNLVVFTHQLTLGGGQLWLFELLDRSGAGTTYPCTVISFGDGPLRGALEERGVTVHVTPPPPVDALLGYQGRVAELSLLVAASGFNAALINTVTAWIGADVTTRMGIPTVWAIHESLSPSAYWAQVYPANDTDSAVRAGFDWALRSSSALVFEAEATRRLYAPAARPNRTVVIPYGIDVKAIERYRKRVTRAGARVQAGLGKRSKVLLVMGTTEPRKAQTRLVEAFALVAEDNPQWTLVMVGDTGSPYARELKRYIARAGLEARTRVVPVVPDTYAWYRAADVLVSASDLESLPRSALEAMCFGLPVVAANVFGLAELVTDGENGFLFEPSDLAAAAEALGRVMALDSDELTEVGEAGRRHIVEHYDAAGYAADVLALLRGMHDDPTAEPSQIVAPRGLQAPAPATLSPGRR